MRMTSEESGMSEGSDKRYVNRSQVSTSVFCLFCNNHPIPEPTSTQFSEKEVFKQHMDVYLQFYFCNNTCNGMWKENPEKCTQDFCEATGIDGLALFYKPHVKIQYEDTLNIFHMLDR